AAAGITGIRAAASNEPITVPTDPRLTPEAIAQAITELRLAGVDGPYSVLVSAEMYTAVSETSDHGYPIRTHIERLLPDGQIIWAPAIDGAFVVTTRGGDFDLQVGQDLSIGYQSHDAESVQLYFQESLTFLVYTAEAAVALRR
ncbi:MAG: encapsulin, partial [Nocardia sp.]|nr:encapsulin [Nocardia sp.]